VAGASHGTSKNVPTPLGEGHIEQFHGSPEPVYDSVPGFPAPGRVATNYDIAVGLERYELLQQLDGKVAFESMLPVVMDRKPTLKNPLLLRGIDAEFYLACSGFPAESHEPVWLTLKDNGYVYRCPTCGCAYKVCCDISQS
jgi:hypothetical protein